MYFVTLTNITFYDTTNSTATSKDRIRTFSQYNNLYNVKPTFFILNYPHFIIQAFFLTQTFFLTVLQARIEDGERGQKDIDQDQCPQIWSTPNGPCRIIRGKKNRIQWKALNSYEQNQIRFPVDLCISLSLKF